MGSWGKCVHVGSLLPASRSLSVFLELSCLGSAPITVPGASPVQLPYAARTASSAVRLRLSLHTSLLAGIVRFGARNIIILLLPLYCFQ